jgi:hypothetical protein
MLEYKEANARTKVQKMGCFCCKRKIQPGEQVIWGSRAICYGPGDMDFIHQVTCGDFMYVVHLDCLEKPAAARETSGTAANELVQRSDALSIFGEM